jgi:hypothetical protein
MSAINQTNLDARCDGLGLRGRGFGIHTLLEPHLSMLSQKTVTYIDRPTSSKVFSEMREQLSHAGWWLVRIACCSCAA